MHKFLISHIYISHVYLFFCFILSILILHSAFNMLTMQKEKVNTHFSFPMKLDMSGYVEKTLLPQQYQESKADHSEQTKRNEEKGTDESDKMDSNTGGTIDDFDDGDEKIEQYEYSLIGVTVHTGNADGGHYYSFIKERNGPHPHAPDRWFLFNDAEVKQFDPSQIEAECFGGEMTSKTYDTVTEKYLDFSFEKTNSAYMLFYERVPLHESANNELHSDQSSSDENLMKLDDTYDQASCSTTTPTPNKMSDFNRLNESFETALSTGSIENAEPITTDTPTDTLKEELEVDQDKCDIDTKSGSECNENADKTVNANKVTSSTTTTMITTVTTATTTATATPTAATTITTTTTVVSPASTSSSKKNSSRHLLNKELEEWIWEDNRYFLQDRNIFEHTYFK